MSTLTVLHGLYHKNNVAYHVITTVVDRKDCTPALLWSKTTRTTGSVGGTWGDPPTSKMGTFLKTINVKDVINVPILQVGGSSHVPPTSPVVWVVLLHKRAGVQSFLSRTVYKYF